MEARGTAIVTGASSGIGAVYCEKLASRGFDLILVARDTARLEAAAGHLRSAFGCRAEPMPADLTDRAALRRVEDRFSSDPAVTMLVNNAGMSLHGGWLTASEDEVAQLIALNTTAPTLLARAAARAFAARDRGAIVNIASVLAFTADTTDGAYSGTKAHLVNLTLALATRFAGTGVKVQAVLPCATRTEIFERSGKSLDDFPAEWIMEPGDLVDAALAGLDRGETVTIPSLPDAGQWEAMDAARRAMVPNLQNGTLAARYQSHA